MKHKLIIAMLLISLGARSQTTWTNVGNGWQQKVSGSDTSYRFIKISGYGAPIDLTGRFKSYLPLAGGAMTGNILYKYDDILIPNVAFSTPPGLLFAKNSDYFKMYFESTSDLDGNSNIIFETGDNSTPVGSITDGYVFRQRNTDSSFFDLLRLSNSQLRYKNFDILHTGNTKTINNISIFGAGNINTTQDLSPYELLSNKQNSLTTDATNTKYPTVSATILGLSAKANLAGGNNLTGDQSVLGGINLTGDATRTVNTISLNSTSSGSGYRGGIALKSYNIVNDGATWVNSIVANPSAGANGSSNQLPSTSGMLLNSTDALSYVKFGNNGSGFGGNAGILFSNDNSYFQTSNTAGNANTKIDPLGLSISNNGFATKFIAAGTNTAGVNVLVRNIGGTMAFTSDIAANNVTYPVNTGGETLQSVTNRGNSTTTQTLFGSASTSSAMVGIQETPTYGRAVSMMNRNGTKRYDFVVDVNSVDDGFFGILDNNTSSYRLSIGSNGNVGVGTPNPISKVTVASGDVETTSSTNGFIMTAPNGSRWRVTVSNTGVLTSTAL